MPLFSQILQTYTLTLGEKIWLKDKLVECYGAALPNDHALSEELAALWSVAKDSVNADLPIGEGVEIWSQRLEIGCFFDNAAAIAEISLEFPMPPPAEPQPAPAPGVFWSTQALSGDWQSFNLHHAEELVETKQKKRGQKVIPKPETLVRETFILPSNAWEFRKKLKLNRPMVDVIHQRPVGIEIEVEQCNVETHVESFDGGIMPIDDPDVHAMLEAWNAKNDGSLRNGGREYVTKFGLFSGDVVNYLPPLHNLFEKGRSKDNTNNDFSYRCGLHIHIDVSDLSLEQLYKAALVYSVVERALFKISGARDQTPSSKFCLPADQCISTLESVLAYGHFGQWQEFRDCFQRGHKYMAMNIRTVATLNTLEFRQHEGTSNPIRIIKWMNLLLDVILSSRNHDRQKLEDEIIALGKSVSYMDFLVNHLPNTFPQITAIQGWERMFREGALFVKETFISEPEFLKQMEID